MACIRTRISKAGVVSYQVIVRIAGQPRLCETFKNKVKARAWGDAMSAAARASLSEFPDVKSYKKVKVRDAIAVWIESGRCPRSMVSMAPSVKLMVGDTDLGHLNAEFIMKYVALARATKSQYKRPFTDVTISKHLCLIRGAVKNEAGKNRVVPDLSIYSTANIKGYGMSQEAERSPTRRRFCFVKPFRLGDTASTGSFSLISPLKLALERASSH